MAANKTIHAQILTPEGSKFDGKILGITVPGASGSFQILHNHSPIVSALDVGAVEFQKEDGSIQTYAVSSGFVEMNDNTVTLLAERAIEPENIDAEQAQKDLAAAKEKIKDTKADSEEVEHQIKVAKNLITLAQN